MNQLQLHKIMLMIRGLKEKQYNIFINYKGHNGTDGSSMSDRIERYGQWEGTIGENIDYGGDKEGKDVLLNLMVDDGVSTRGHRNNIFNPEFKMVFISFKI